MSAATTNRRPLGADAGVTGALLPEQLLGAAGDFTAGLRLVAANALVGLVHDDDIVQQLLVDFRRERIEIDVVLADFGAALIENW